MIFISACCLPIVNFLQPKFILLKIEMKIKKIEEGRFKAKSILDYLK